MKVLFVSDDPKVLNFESDTSLAIARSVLKSNKKVYWCESQDFSWTPDGVRVSAKALTKFKEKAPRFGGIKNFPLEFFQKILIRKNPPFNKSYVDLCWLLSPYEHSIKMVNKPSLLLRYHEKMLPLDACVRGYLKKSDLIPTCITADKKLAANFIQKRKELEFVIKPFYGFGGSAIHLVDKSKALRFVRSKFNADLEWMIQPLEKQIYEKGDRRVFFFKGKYSGDIVRMPKRGKIVSNLAQGGSAEFRKLSPSEKKVIDRLGKFLKVAGVDFAGADLIGDKVSEVNITSPTGFVAFQKISKVDLGEKFVRSIL